MIFSFREILLNRFGETTEETSDLFLDSDFIVGYSERFVGDIGDKKIPHLILKSGEYIPVKLDKDSFVSMMEHANCPMGHLSWTD